MTLYYTSQAMLENRLSAAVVRRVLDDNNDGTADTDPVTQLLEDAEARFESFARQNYTLETLRSAAPTEAKRLCLDVAVALACERFPKAVGGRQWLPLWQKSETELKDLAAGRSRLNVTGAPEPQANQGGDYYASGETLSTIDDVPDTYTHGGFGSF
jgi:phage gp36-like protein